jgi:hypothetical protein
LVKATDHKKDEFSQQFSAGSILLLMLLLMGLFLFQYSMVTAFFWISGIAFGYTLQRSRFCFVAGLRDPALTGSTAMTRGVLVALAVTSIGFTAIKYFYYITGQTIPGQSYISSIGMHTVIGGTIFGIGMVIAGGCASGMLMRIGEGFEIHLITLLGFFFGTLLGNNHLEWWQTHLMWIEDGVFLPDVFGWAGALIIQLLVIGLLYGLAMKWEEKQEL